MNQWGDFELLEEIGRGSFGTVYRANHPTLQQQVALKLVPVPSGSAREIEKALEEPRRLASIRHQHVVVVHDARHIDGHVGICMELVRGESLAQVVTRSGRLGAEETIACGANLCRALSAIHRAEIIHNDVKAQNVMRETGGRIVLMDFGAGRRLVDPHGTTGLYLVGTPAYMAPELFELRTPSPSSDIYSLGVLLFYLLTSLYPVDGATMEQFAAAHASRRRRYLGDVRDDIPARLLTVVDRALEHDPAERYGSCGEMLSDLVDRNQRRGHRSQRKQQEQPAPGKDSGSKRRDSERTRTHPDPAFKEARRWAGEWIGPAVAVVTGAVLVVWLLGFLASKAFNDMFGLTGEFAEESPFRWLEVGFQTLPLPLFYMVMAVTVFLVAGFFWRLVVRMSPGLGHWSARSSQRIASVGARAGLTDDGSLPTAVLFVQLLLLAIVYWRFGDLVTAIFEPIAIQTIREHALLAGRHENERLMFCAAASVLALASGVTWWTIARRRRPDDGGMPAVIAGIALTGVFVVMFAVPWRIFWQANFPTVLFDSTQCFVVAQESPRLLLLCPTAAGARNPIVTERDLTTKPDQSVIKPIFDEVARDNRLEETQ